MIMCRPFFVFRIHLPGTAQQRQQHGNYDEVAGMMTDEDAQLAERLVQQPVDNRHLTPHLYT